MNNCHLCNSSESNCWLTVKNTKGDVFIFCSACINMHNLDELKTILINLMATLSDKGESWITH